MGKEKTAISRTAHASRNIIFSMTAYLIQIVLGFLLRRYFIYYFNEEYLGLNSLFTNVISLLSLAELGFGSAIVFSMYKPMAENDTKKVSQLLYFYKKCYRIIGFVVLACGLCVLPFMNYFQAQAPNVDINLYLIYLIYLFNSVVSYFFAYRRALLYTSQRNDIESKVNIVCNVTLVLLQLVVVLFLKNFYIYVSLIGIVNICNNVIIYYVTEKKYKDFIIAVDEPLSKEDRKIINKNIFALVCHKIGGVLVQSTDSLLIYFMLGSTELGKYSNYLLITSSIAALTNLYLSAIRSSVGNSIASESPEKNKKLFNKLNCIHFFIISFCTICIFCLSDPFIDVVLTKKADVNLLVDSGVLLLISLNFFFTQSRYLVCVFKESAGLFYEDRVKPLFEALVNLVVSILLTLWIGLPGIILGTIASNLFVCLWVEPHVLNKHYLKGSTKKYFCIYFFYSIVMLLSCGLTKYVSSFINATGIVSLIFKFATCGIVAGVSLIGMYMFFPEFRSVCLWIKGIVQGFLKKKLIAETVGAPSIDIDGDGIVDSLPVEIGTNEDNFVPENNQNEEFVSEVEEINVNNLEETNEVKDENIEEVLEPNKKEVFQNLEEINKEENK